MVDNNTYFRDLNRSRQCRIVDSFYKTVIVYDLKSVGSLKIEFVAPIPEQLKTITIHLFEDSGEPYLNLPAEKVGCQFFPISSTGDPKNDQFGVDFSPLTLQVILNIVNFVQFAQLW